MKTKKTKFDMRDYMIRYDAERFNSRTGCWENSYSLDIDKVHDIIIKNILMHLSKESAISIYPNISDSSIKIMIDDYIGKNIVKRYKMIIDFYTVFQIIQNDFGNEAEFILQDIMSEFIGVIEGYPIIVKRLALNKAGNISI